MFIQYTVNEYGTPVGQYKCETCGDIFTVCPAPERARDDRWKGCLATVCASYDPDRDIEWLFDDGNVKSFEQRKNPATLIRRPIND